MLAIPAAAGRRAVPAIQPFLAYLSLERPGGCHRERVIESLWPEAEQRDRALAGLLADGGQHDPHGVDVLTARGREHDPSDDGDQGDDRRDDLAARRHSGARGA